ncbi:hypothetical protein [Kingella sp. (in: b-proteobacteria)]|uniref:hypothetical protein n=1 Tax=Kingella sp. (in: b-proteobacteria) TaxID=2020713 RepID=UPI0026DB917F|nr:hypothetical protein [Kingella sp. (in: b-proteobacteria)]MDO4657070.1 hypothetical protein [Kingella sp. (in: b-proteobacteria)]
MDATAQLQQYSDIAVIFVLLYTIISVVALSVYFVKKSKLHLIWTLTLGSLLAFVAGFLLVDLFNTGWLGAIGSILLTLLSLSIWLDLFGYLPRSRNRTLQSNTQLEIERLHRLGAPRCQAASITPRFPATPLPPLSPAQRKKIKRQQRKFTPSTPPTRNPYARKGTQVSFTYTNNKGITKSRRVQITEIDDTYLHGIDLDIHEMRTFTRRKIHNREVVDINTGEIIKVKNL